MSISSLALMPILWNMGEFVDLVLFCSVIYVWEEVLASSRTGVFAFTSLSLNFLVSAFPETCIHISRHRRAC